MQELSLQVEDGEYFVLLGPPGSGKTLLLDALCGLRRLDSGRFFINRVDVTELEPRRRMIGYVPQDYALFPHRTVAGNIRFGLESAGIHPAEIDLRVGEIADQLNIRNLLHRSIQGLSGGERQQVALGRALVTHPKVLLLDEPVSALDETTRESICSELKRIQRELGLTTIHVCHQLQEAFSVADRAGIMRHGGFQQIGTMQELSNTPKNSFVANFMRCRNIIEAQVTGSSKQDGWKEVKAGIHRMSIPCPFEGSIRLVIRPDCIRLDGEDDPDAMHAIRIPAQIRRVADQGACMQVETDASFPLILYASRDELARMRLMPGSSAFLLIRPEHIHALDTEEERCAL